MKWIYFFGNLDGRIGRKTFWIASITVVVIEFIIATIAAVITKELVNKAAGHTAADIVMLLFLFPQFVIAVKARPRSQYFHLGRQRVACAACHNGCARSIWLAADPDQSKRLLAGKSAFVCIYDDRGSRQPCASDRALLSPWHQWSKPLRARPAR
jgi:hypothetical protein